MQLRIWAALIGSAMAWGTTGVATRAALNAGVPPVGMVAIRALAAAVLLYGLLVVRRTPITRDKERWRTGVVAAVFQLATPFVLFTLAYQHASAGFIGLLVALIPLGTAIVAHFLLPDEPLHTAKVIGLTVAFAGVALLLASGNSGLGTAGQPVLAALLSVGAVASISIASVYTKSRSHTFDPIELTWMQFAVASILLIGVMLGAEGMPTAISTWGWALIAYLTVVGSVLPFLLFYWLLRQVTATMASLVGYIVPLIALVSGIVLLDERLEPGIAIGGALILAGVVLTNQAERKVFAAPTV